MLCLVDVRDTSSILDCQYALNRAYVLLEPWGWFVIPYPLAPKFIGIKLMRCIMENIHIFDLGIGILYLAKYFASFGSGSIG